MRPFLLALVAVLLFASVAQATHGPSRFRGRGRGGFNQGGGYSLNFGGYGNNGFHLPIQQSRPLRFLGRDRFGNPIFGY